MGARYNIAIPKTMPMTPPSLFGTERRMAYPKRKYHSGLMWAGVTSWLAMIKFSASMKAAGKYMHTKTSLNRSRKTPRMSLKANNGLKETLST